MWRAWPIVAALLLAACAGGQAPASSSAAARSGHPAAGFLATVQPLYPSTPPRELVRFAERICSDLGKGIGYRSLLDATAAAAGRHRAEVQMRAAVRAFCPQYFPSVGE